MSFFRNLLPTALAFALVSTPALAQEEAAAESTEADDALLEDLELKSPFPTLDFGVATGFNNPSGFFGVETHLLLNEHVGVGVLGGFGAWGFRLTPQARLYPFNASEVGLFLEGGLSLNLGGREGFPPKDPVTLGLTPTATTALGYRFPILDGQGWGLLRAGWGFRLREENLHSSDGTPLAPGLYSLRQHEGFLIGAALGAVIF
jgi:hypothetical protein